MPLILGVDASLTATGLARIKVGDWSDDDKKYQHLIEVCTVGAPGPKTKTFREYSRRVTYVVERIGAAMEGVDLVVMEELAYGAKGATAYVLPWIWGRVFDECEARDVPVGVVGTGQLKKYATGKGNADKDIVLAAMVRRYPEVAITNNNESDALVLATIGARALGCPVDHPTVQKEEVMTKLGVLANV